MRIVSDVDRLPAGLRFALTIGVFDGVHRGHVRALSSLVREAQRLRAEPVVLSFDPHPEAVLRGEAPPLLCDPAERLAHLARLGVGTTVIQRFDRRFAEQSADQFLDRVRRNRQLAGLVMTPESAFGRDRGGDLPNIRRLGDRLGFTVFEVSPLFVGGAPISSTRLRSLLAQGRLADARRLLGRRYAVIGSVVRGDGRGRDLGFPTANLGFEAAVALPRDGIYAVRTGWGGDNPLEPRRQADGAASLGVRPTFGGGARTLEVYLFGLDEDLYGQRLRVEFVRRLRGEKRFSSPDALVKQMRSDVERARRDLES